MAELSHGFVVGAEMRRSKFCAGDWAQVRSREEILATLDADGRLDGMLFMPEMLSYCGKTLRVFKRAHKACDTICETGARKVEGAVHLESRCDGSAHGGCQADCLLYWKEAWLKPVNPEGTSAQLPHGTAATARAAGCTMKQLAAATQHGHDPEKGPCYACQVTELLRASSYLSPWDPRQYIEDYRSGNVTIGTMLRGALYRLGVFSIRRAGRLGRRLGLGDALAKALTACYDVVQRVLPNGVPFPRRNGTIPKGQPTPNVPMGPLRAGSWVRVKPYPEILATLNTDNKTQGLQFDGELVPYCGKKFPVRSLVTQIIDERTGFMLHFKSPSIVLENVHCQGTFSDGRMFCPRSIYAFWRPAWITPLDGTDGTRGESPSGDSSDRP